MSATSARNLADWLAVRGLTLVPLARSNQRDKHVVLTTNGFRTRVQFPPGPPAKRNGLPDRVGRFVLLIDFAGIAHSARRDERAPHLIQMKLSAKDRRDPCFVDGRQSTTVPIGASFAHASMTVARDHDISLAGLVRRQASQQGVSK